MVMEPAAAVGLDPMAASVPTSFHAPESSHLCSPPFFAAARASSGGGEVVVRWPAEWEAHGATVLAWPVRDDVWRDGAGPARRAVVAVAKAILSFDEPVIVCVSREAGMESARQMLPPEVMLVACEYDDVWLRDIAPVFVRASEGLCGVKFGFNAWGSQCYSTWERDSAFGAELCGELRAHVADVPGLVLEGGAVHTDGQGTLITTESVVLDAQRNPGMSRDEAEAMLKRSLGVSVVIWIRSGLAHDQDTRGHVDNLLTYVRPGEVLLSWTDDEEDEEFHVVREALAVLEASVDARGRRLVVHTVPLPPRMHTTEKEAAGVVSQEGTLPREAGGRLCGSYVNLALVNGCGIVAPLFGPAACAGLEGYVGEGGDGGTYADLVDAAAMDALQRAFPDRRVVGVPAREIILGGGGIHCMTTHFPAKIVGGAEEPHEG